MPNRRILGRAVSHAADRGFGTIALTILFSLSATWFVPLILSGRTGRPLTGSSIGWLLGGVYAVAAMAVVAGSFISIRRRLGRERATFLSHGIEQRHPAERSLSECLAVLRDHGFTSGAPKDGCVIATRNAAGPYVGMVVGLGISLVLAATAVHAWTSSSVTFVMAEGQTIAKSLSSSGYIGEAARPYLSAQGLVLKSVVPRFRGSDYELRRLSASLSDGGVQKTVAWGRPLWVNAMTTVSVLDFDMAPQFIVHSEDGSLAEDTVRPLDLLPPGEDQSFDLYSAKARINLRVGSADEAGSASGRDFGLKDVRFVMTAISRVSGVPERVVLRKVVGVGDEVSINDFNVRLASVRTAGTFRVTRAPALPFVLSGLALVLLGLCVRVLYRRVDVCLIESDDGVAYVAHDDVFGFGGGRRYVDELLAGAGRDG